ncbi:MAG: tyrosinase family protein [Candidatus Cybelea sp.]
MMETSMRRRAFFEGGGAFAAVALLRPGLVLAADPTKCNNAKPFSSLVDTRPITQRRYVSGLTSNPDALAKLRLAYGNMVTWGNAHPDDPRGWPLQWLIHQIAGETLGIHTTWWFFPWHRAYLYFHERILAWHATGERGIDPTFRLFTWDWDNLTDSPQYMDIPQPFADARLPGNTPNPLWHDKKTPAPMQFSLGYIDPADSLRAPLQFFFGSSQDSGPLSQGPHGFVHEMTGGDMMDPSVSTKDPIFYAHHANVDKIWSWYRNLPGGGDPGGAMFSAWQQVEWTFTDYDGSCIKVSATDMINQARLRYTYPDPTKRLEGPGGGSSNDLAILPNSQIGLSLASQKAASTAQSSLLRLENIRVPGRGVYALFALTGNEFEVPAATLGHFSVFSHGDEQTVTAYIPIRPAVAKLFQRPSLKLGLWQVPGSGSGKTNLSTMALEWTPVNASGAQLLTH